MHCGGGGVPTPVSCFLYTYLLLEETLNKTNTNKCQVKKQVHIFFLLFVQIFASEQEIREIPIQIIIIINHDNRHDTCCTHIMHAFDRLTQDKE